MLPYDALEIPRGGVLSLSEEEDSESEPDLEGNPLNPMNNATAN